VFQLWPKVTTLIIEPAGISVQQAGKTVQFIENELPVESNTKTLQDLLNLLEQHSHLIQKQSIHILLSNNFVRFGLLPWRDDVFKKADWHALATAHMRQVYGAAVDAWQINIQSQGFAKPYWVNAVDSSFMLQLEALIKQVSAKLESVTAAFDYVAEMYNSKISSNDALLLSEPGRLVLASREHGAWQQINVVAPPQQQQQKQVNSAIQRLLATQAKAPKQVLLFGAAKADVAELEQQTRLVELTKVGQDNPLLADALLGRK
jgi:hypothetical protein